jgi:L-arabinose isomerase
MHCKNRKVFYFFLKIYKIFERFKNNQWVKLVIVWMHIFNPMYIAFSRLDERMCKFINFSGETKN